MGYVEVALGASLVGAAVGGIFMFLMPAKKCQECQADLPRFISLAERRRLGVPMGGCACQQCKTIYDATGKKVSAG
ncbi:hypothetical protein GCM10010971_05120 [Silvimonas amylolytica]|uniref:Uncharacterized protein n=1 Tax=Silvimonas amylolytica TaxID=449663 RepID=A0ABQ2PHA4_9NEIS|nr:hypothetical protein GCM10010971_05120 [Silvimonas amylolytica]